MQQTRHPSVPINTMLNTALVRSTCIRDLEVLLDQKMPFRPHIDSVVVKENQLLSLITRTCSELTDPMCVKSIFCAIVRSCLEYCCPIWCPLGVGDINRLEAIQRRITRYAVRLLPWQPHHTRPSYHQRCLLLGLEPLCSRRKNAQCLIIFRLLTGEIDSPASLANINLFAGCRILRSNFHLRVPRARNNHSQGHPIICMSLEFNEVLDLFDVSMPTSTFKDKLHLRYI